MEHRGPIKIRYTTNCFAATQPGSPLGPSILSYSRDDGQLDLHNLPPEARSEPVLEIVTDVDAAYSGVTDAVSETTLRASQNVKITNTRQSSMIVRSEILSGLIRCVVKFYPSQKLSGENIVINEPYAVLMHHISGFEELATRLENESSEVGKEVDNAKRQHLQVLLDFIRPKYEQWCLPIQARQLQAEPTVAFEDIWFLMKPGTLAYVYWDNHWLGCSIEQVTKLPSVPAQKTLERWSIDIRFLQMSGTSGDLICASAVITISQFDGEMPISSLQIFPRDFYDKGDSGARREQFEKRGDKIAQILWEECPRHMSYEGECLDNYRQYYKGQIVVDGSQNVTSMSVEHHWTFDWEPLKSIRQRTSLDNENELDSDNDWGRDRESLTKEHLFIISPCLSAYAVVSQSWILIHVGNTRELDLPNNVPEPLISTEKMKILNAVVDSQVNHKQLLPADLTGYRGKGVIILLHGPPGVGKTSTVEFQCLRIRRPLLVLTMEVIRRKDYYGQEDEMKKWISLGERWEAVICINGEDKYGTSPLFHYVHLMRQTFTGIVFFITNKPEDVEKYNWPSIQLMVRFDDLDGRRRKIIWEKLQQKLEHDQKHKVRLSDKAKKLLDYNEIHELKWNGHTIAQCFRSAVALAEFEARRSPEYRDGEEIMVGEDHFKDAINMTAESNPTEDEDLDPYSYAPRTNKSKSYSRGVSWPAEPRAVEEKPIRSLWAINSDSEINLCIPDLNRIGWEGFKAAASSELFRKTKYYAIDVLMGEPIIKLQVGKKASRRRKVVGSNRTDQKNPEHSKGQARHDTSTLPTGQGPLPERIRINSMAIMKVFRDILDEGALDPKNSVLVFRPFRSLVYYEQEFREWVARQETRINKNSTPKSDGTADEEDVVDRMQGSSEERSENDITQEQIDNDIEERVDIDTEEDLDIDREKAALEDMRCLLSFIEEYIKPKQEFLKSPLCHSVTFADIWFLFIPGDTVMDRDSRQAYRIIEVKSTRHRVKKPSKETPNFWRDDSNAEFEDNPVFIHCVHVDFDGFSIGPVSTIISIPRFNGVKDVSSLPIFPLRFAKDATLHEKLTKRGRLFAEVARVKHMHYSGLTLQAHDEVDSQVVVDFEEAFTRNANWRPEIQSVFGVDMEEMIKDMTVEPVTSVRQPNPFDDERNDGEEITGWCVKECCENEITHHDEFVEARFRDEYIRSRMESGTPTTPSVAIVPRPIGQTTGENTLSDDDVMIMSYRVFGFVLRNRKWAKLDLENISEVAVLGEDKGFDQLVLPPGHKDMVKSMIRQHFRDKNFMQDDKDLTDVVRGKGKGLIMLLHGVPGVGKTSTAECVADSFRRPLFQITSGDLGTTAKEVEEALETNFTLANRWNCILLIDEADVFLAERTKEDFVRNSLVAVFLRIMEYYAGVLFLTTNRVGVFDEAFTSRIHISLYYPPLERDPTHKIFEKNMERSKARYESNERKIDIRESEISKFALDYFDQNSQGRWNGRQIRNAFQSAIALAELEAHGMDDVMSEPNPDRLVTLRRSHFEVVAAAYKGFTDYLNQTYGADFARRARENLWRSDTFGMAKVPNPLTTRLKVAEPRPVSEPWPQQAYAGYGLSSGAQPPYPPQGAYPAYPPYQAHDPRFNPNVAPAAPRDPREGLANPAPYAGHPTGMPGALDRHPGGQHIDVYNAPQPGEPSIWGGNGRGNPPPGASG